MFMDELNAADARINNLRRSENHVNCERKREDAIEKQEQVACRVSVAPDFESLHEPTEKLNRSIGFNSRRGKVYREAAPGRSAR